MYEELIAERGGIALGDASPSSVDDDFRFECLVVEDDGPLPLLARLDPARPRFLLKSGRVGGAEGESGSAAITEGDAVAALDAALDPDAEWERDPDLGAEILVSPVEGLAQELLIPRFLYRRADRIYEYAAAVPGLLAAHPWLPGPAERAPAAE